MINVNEEEQESDSDTEVEVHIESDELLSIKEMFEIESDNEEQHKNCISILPTLLMNKF